MYITENIFELISSVQTGNSQLDNFGEFFDSLQELHATLFYGDNEAGVLRGGG